MKLILPEAERVLLTIIDDCFDAISSKMPDLILPTPIGDSFEDIESENITARVEHRLMQTPAYEAAIAQTAIHWALNTNGLSRGKQAAAIDLTYELLPGMSLYDTPVNIKRDNTVGELISSFGGAEANLSHRKETSIIDVMLATRFGLNIAKPSATERSAARTAISEHLGAVFMVWLAGFGFDTKALRIGYLLALQDAKNQAPALELPTRRRFHDLSLLDCDPSQVIRNLKSKRIVERHSRSSTQTEMPNSFWYQGFENSFEYYSKRG